MKQLLILSGKGGTGKTTIASAFIRLSNAKAYADCDVDAPNLHLLYGVANGESDTRDYYALPTAIVDDTRCIGCMRCQSHCKFGAISSKNSHAYVDVHSCEGCGVCAMVCPANAIDMRELPAGKIMLEKGDDRVFAHAELKMGSGTTGKLVTEVKKTLIKNVHGADIAIVDGSPGIGCPVIASLSGVDTVLIVAEPSLSGVSDMKRIVDTARGFGVKVAVCVNKYDLNRERTEEIERYCVDNDLYFAGTIPYDKMALKAINGEKTIVDIPCESGKAVENIYRNVMEYM